MFNKDKSPTIVKFLIEIFSIKSLFPIESSLQKYNYLTRSIKI